MEKMPKIGKYQPVKSYSMVYDITGNIVNVLEQKQTIDIKKFEKDPDIFGKIRGWICDTQYVIFEYNNIQNFKPATKKKKEDK